MSRSATRTLFLAVAVLLFSVLPSFSQTSLVATGSVWKFFDKGFEPSGWKGLLFDDSAWGAGPGQLGFGDGDEATLISRTNSAGLTNIAFYFRHTLNVPDPSAFSNLMVRLRRDDGVVVYLNEIEVFRNNMPAGPVNSNTLALTAVSDDGNGLFAGPVSPALLNIGDNQLAVEVHQSGASSTDVTFDLELLGNVTFQPPTVSLVMPGAGDTIGGSTVWLIASAGDADGTITAVEFFNGAAWIGSSSTPTNLGFVHPWTNVAPGAYVVSAVAVDSTGLSATSSPVSITVLPALIPRGAAWKYLDNGSDAGSAWKEPGFDDTAWSNGLAQFGYGDGDETTVISYGPDVMNRYVTTYFRHAFDTPNPAAFSNLVLRVQRDDGVIVYLNGTEVFRNNMPTGTVSYTSLAVAAIEDELFHGVPVSTGLLNAGANVIAAEIHQANVTSSDVSFDLELLANVAPRPPSVRLAAPASGATFLGPLNLALTAFVADVDDPVASVTFLDGSATLGTVGVDVTGGASGNYSFSPGQHTLYAVATDTMGLSTTSAPVNVTVIPAPMLTTLVATGSVWWFYDTNAAPAGDWRSAGFDDLSWRSGPGVLGFGTLGSGGAMPATIINFGPSGNRHVTAYFRHVFNATNVADITNLNFRVLRDDGAVVYLNGAEVFRMNMNTGIVSYATRASATVSGTNELFYAPQSIVPWAGLLAEGPNLLAVEIHQDNPMTTSDTAFDLSLVAVSPPTSRPRLQIQFDGTNVHLTWNAPGFTLVEAAAPEGPYTPATNAVSPRVFSPSLPARYFRLRQP